MLNWRGNDSQSVVISSLEDGEGINVPIEAAEGGEGLIISTGHA